MGYRCGFLLLSEEKNKVTKAIEELFIERVEKFDGKISSNTSENGIDYLYFNCQGYYISEGFDAEKWFKKPNGVLNMKKNQKYNILFESCHSGSGFEDIFGGGGGTFKDFRSGERYSYYDQDLFYAIIDKVKGIKNNNVKLFTFDVNDGIRRTRPKFAQDWTGKFL